MGDGTFELNYSTQIASRYEAIIGNAMYVCIYCIIFFLVLVVILYRK